MSDFSTKLEEITQILVSLDVGASKSLAYSTLLRLQEQSVSDHDAIAVQAMKCLGFMIHQPTILASIPVDSPSISFFFLHAIWDEIRVYVLEWRKMAFLGAAVGVAAGALESLANVIVTAKK